MTTGGKHNIPQANPGAAYRAHREAYDAAVKKVLAGGWYILGGEGEAFEEEFAGWIGTAHGVGVASGTDALELALRALNVGKGDLVATVSHTAVATAAAVVRTGAVPLFLDVAEETFTMDPGLLEDVLRKKGGKVRAVIPVHLYGRPADMPSIMEIAGKFDVPVIEDCAQAHGAAIAGKTVGTFGIMSAFSFYPTKNLGAFGDAGAVLTSDGKLAARLRSLRQYGSETRGPSALPGVNSRLDEIQAAILRVRLGYLDQENLRRQDIAGRYNEGISGAGYILPAQGEGVSHVFHQYVVRHPVREGVMERLRQAGIGTAIHYPVPVHLQPAFSGFPLAGGGLGVTERLCGEIFSLPVYPHLTDGEVEYIIETAVASDHT